MITNSGCRLVGAASVYGRKTPLISFKGISSQEKTGRETKLPACCIKLHAIPMQPKSQDSLIFHKETHYKRTPRDAVPSDPA